MSQTLTELIEALGPDVDTVRATLAEKGIKGRKCGVCLCPIAVYVRSNGFPDGWAGGSSIASKSNRYGDSDTYGPNELITTPKHIYAFMQRFDRGEFPELEV